MLIKNWLIKKRNKCSLCFELVLPFIFMGILFLINLNSACNDRNDHYEIMDDPDYCNKESTIKRNHYSNSTSLPLILCFFLVFAFFFSGKYILTNVVADKENKMRETLRIMGLS